MCNFSYRLLIARNNRLFKTHSSGYVYYYGLFAGFGRETEERRGIIDLR
jgi:hypothetical protein